MKVAFIAQEVVFRVETMSGVERSGFYAWRKLPNPVRAKSDTVAKYVR